MGYFLLPPSLRKIRKKYRNNKKGRRQKKNQVEQKIFCDFGKKRLKKSLHFQSTRITTLSSYH